MGSNRALRLGLLTAACTLSPAAMMAEQIVTLDEVVISGGMTAIAQDAYGRAATVLTADDIAARGIATVQDALRALPGLSVSGSGASLTQVRIRGGEADHVLILIDGVKAAGGADEYVLTGLETANIERIEVLRGPQSVVYGSNASTGVINIITRKAEPGQQARATVEAGNGWAGSAQIGLRGARGGLSFSLAARDDRGYDHSGDGGEKDGIRRRSLGLAGDVQATENLELGFNLRRSAEDFDYDGTDWAATDAAGYVVDDAGLNSARDESTGALWAEYSALDGRLVHRLEWQQSILKQSYEGGPVTRGETRKLKYRASLGLDGALAAASHQLHFMLEDQDDRSTSAPGTPRQMRSAALEYRGFLQNGLDVQLGLRHDDNKVFRDFTSWNIGLSYALADSGLRLHGSAGTGLVNPSFFELFADVDYGEWGRYVGNPDLRPETNRGYDLGVEAAFWGGRGVVDVTYFNERVQDAIDYDYSVPGVISFVNLDGSSPREGVELAARLQPTEGLSMALNYTWINARNPDGTKELRRPRHEIGLSVTQQAFGGRGAVTADLRHVAGNFDREGWGAAAVSRLPDATTVGLAARYDLTETVELTGRISNLFDRRNVDVWGYATEGRTAWIGVQAQW